MRIALVTTPAESRSGIGDYSRHLLPYLREHAEVELFVDIGLEGEEGDERTRPVDELQPREYDQILYQLGNEMQHAFMVPLVQALGGTVMLHDWVLFDLSLAAYPALKRGGFRGLRRAFCEGGLEEAAIYWKNKRGAGREPKSAGGVFRSGWHVPEQPGRWCAAQAVLALPPAEELRLDLVAPLGRTLEIRRGGSSLGRWTFDDPDEEVELALELDPDDLTPLELEVGGVRPTPEQLENEDARELALFVRRAELRLDGTRRRLDLCEPVPEGAQGLSRDRFRLALNRSIVRRADAFLVHSDWMGERILASRNAPTPIARVHHGVEQRWSDVDRRVARDAIEPADRWRDDFLLVSLGALQGHKRPDVLLRALARARRERGDLRLLLVGEERPAEFDLSASLANLGLEDAVRVTGWLPEIEAWRALHAADLCVNLRGPSAGGTSGGASQALSLGRGVIVSDLPEVAQLPADCVLRVAPDETEIEQLARLFVELRDDESRRAKMEQAARRAVEEELHWSHVARRYVEAMKTFPHARAARRSVLVRFAQATAREKHRAT